MKELDIRVAVKKYSYDELPEADRLLVEKAKEMTRKSYAPYSKFHVGAAILMENGEIATGSNQENAAFPSGTCAERTAAYHASAQYPGVKMLKIAIAAWNKRLEEQGLPYEECFQNLPISPCGACRQALMEYEHLYGKMEVILYGREGVYVVDSVASLLPLTFDSF